MLTRKAASILSFCTLYLGFQIFVIVNSHFTPSKHFGFWMFPESTYFTATLFRITAAGRQLQTNDGRWIVTNEAGRRIRYEWSSMIRGYRLDALGRQVRSKGTWTDTVRYFEGALDYVAERIPEDTETYRLKLELTFEKAGARARTITRYSRPRFGAPHDG